jgi:antitoxin component YwqK of YwqJK toxin-antitoxin module
MKKITTFIFLFVTNILLSQSKKIGDTIHIEYSVQGMRISHFVRKGWHKVTKNNKTIRVVGQIMYNFWAIKEYKKKPKFHFLDETVENKSDWIYSISDEDNLQFIIKDGDTINYYDDNGRRQGVFYNYIYYKKGGQYNPNKDKYLKGCDSCSWMFSESKYKNDTLKESIIYGVIGNKKDTFLHRYYINDTFYRHREIVNIDPNFYTIEYYVKPKNEQYFTWLNDTVKTYYKTGELYSTMLRSDIFGIRGESAVYWKNGNKKFVWNFENNSKHKKSYEFYENGKIKYEFEYNYGKLISKKEF